MLTRTERDAPKIMDFEELCRLVDDMPAEDAVDHLLGIIRAEWMMATQDDVDRWRILGFTPREAIFMAVLVRAKSEVVSREALYEKMFAHERGDGPLPKIIDAYLHKVRKRINSRNLPYRIETIHGYGVRLVRTDAGCAP